MGRKPKYGKRAVRIDALLPPETVSEMEQYKKKQRMTWGDLIVDMWGVYKAVKGIMVVHNENNDI